MAAVDRLRARPRDGLPPAAWRAKCSRHACSSAAPWCRSAGIGSIEPDSAPQPGRRQPLLLPRPEKPPRGGKPIRPGRARRAPPAARRSNSWPKACLRAGARRSMASSTPSSPARWMSLNAAQGVADRAGMAAASSPARTNADEMRMGNERQGRGFLLPCRRRPRRYLHRLDRSWRDLRSSRPVVDFYPAPALDHRFGVRSKPLHRPPPSACVGIRAVPVGQAMLACVLADHLLRHRAQNPDAPTMARLPRN